LCDRVESGHDKVIGKVKDIMAAYVLITVIGAIVVGLLVFYNHFILL
jgi:diacylglycerol kinase